MGCNCCAYANSLHAENCQLKYNLSIEKLHESVSLRLNFCSYARMRAEVRFETLGAISR